jgi:spore coat protein U-like protein
MKLLNASLLATALAAAVLAAPAQAADTADFKVLIDIDASCDVVSTQNIDFDTQFANPGTLNATGEVVVQCTNGQAYDVQLDGGGSNDISARRMVNAAGTDSVAYQLYQDAARSNVWGQTDGTDTVSGTGTGYGTGAAFDRVHTVYAQATLAGDELAGAYEDTVTATVTF